MSVFARNVRARRALLESRTRTCGSSPRSSDESRTRTCGSSPRSSVLLFALAWCVVTPAVAWARHRDGAPATGLRTVSYAKMPPDFAFDDGSGSKHLMTLIGKPVVLNFWATWCEPCRDELDAFEKLRARYGDTVSLVTVSGEAPGVARSFLRDRNIALPVVEDSERRIFTAYAVAPIPVTVVLRNDGTVSYVSIGEVTWEELRAAVDAARDLTPPSARATVVPNASTPEP